MLRQALFGHAKQAVLPFDRLRDRGEIGSETAQQTQAQGRSATASLETAVEWHGSGIVSVCHEKVSKKVFV